ncbi:MAG: phenylalanine--tRNA ligase subunit beta [Patescibacteria group bacterium]|nr:phenylalanine--tRNA ligase subunit beta [Patescibacteria group bacterium]
MIFSYNWLQSFSQKKLPKPDKLAELLVAHIFEVESVKNIKNDCLLDIDVLANRGSDCLSHMGIAREIAAITETKIKNPELKIIESKNLRIKDFIAVNVKDKNACKRYTARVITDLKVGPSPKYIQEMLKSCGLKPINNIVDITNYVMLEMGQPLHAFDFDKIKNKHSKSQMPKKIIIRKSEIGEDIITLDNKKYNLDENVLIIADETEPLAIAGIKGGKRAEIDKNTKTIVIESANFNPRLICVTSKKIGLKTDSSWRFEHGIDPNLTEMAINRAALLIQKLANGKIVSGLADVYPKKVFPKKLMLDLNYVERLLGVKISKSEVEKILRKLEFKIKKSPKTTVSTPKNIEVEAPPFRLDISIQEDLIEEIGRIYQYKRILPVFPNASLIPSQRNLKIFWENMVKDILKGVGFSEVYNYSFINENDAEFFNKSTKELIELSNPISSEQKYLRSSLIPILLKDIQRNQKYFSEIKIFELGKIFYSQKNNKKFEKNMFGGLIFRRKPKIDCFYSVKGVIDFLARKLGIGNVLYNPCLSSLESNQNFIFSSMKCAEIKINGQPIGFLGEISKRVLDDLKIDGKVGIFNIDFEKLAKFCSEEYEYEPISKFPASIRDISILTPRDTKVVDILNEINIVGSSIVRDVVLFDIYEGIQISKNKKNLAFHIIYQSKDKTLLSNEIDDVHRKIINALETNPEWEVRK